MRRAIARRLRRMADRLYVEQPGLSMVRLDTIRLYSDTTYASSNANASWS